MIARKSSIKSEDLLKQLASNDHAAVLQAMVKLERAGNINDLPSIIRIMSGITEASLIKEFTYFLSNVRSVQAPAILAQFLADPDFANIRVELVRACWESDLDYTPHLMLFTRLFIAGDYMLALEAFTVIENTFLERQVSMEILKEILSLISNSLPDQPETKQRLTLELIHVLEPYLSGG